MMLTLHGLPSAFNYHELKMMIKHESSLNDFILDNLVTEGDGTKKVRIGVADESEGSHLIKCLDGFRLRGNILRVVPVAKAPINPQQGNFNQRPGFPPRNDIQRQPGNYGSQPPGPMGARPSPWAPNSNQWTPNQGPGQQIPQNNFGFQQGSNPPYSQQQQTPPTLQRPDPKSFGQRDIGNRMPPHDQSYGFAQKNVIPNDANRRVEARQLRSVEVVPGAAPHARAPLAHAAQPPRFGDKPLTINKDYFQGSNQFGPTGPGHFQPSPQNQQAPWSQPVQQAQKSPGFKPPQFDEERKFPPTDKRPGLPKEPDVRNLPNTYKEYEKGPYPPQPERRADPPRRMSPGRRGSPGRRIGGRESPRRVSPHKRLSPGRRLVSPPRGPERRESPSRHGMRYSPSRRGDKGDKFPAAPKQVRPAYEPETPNQTSYPGGYRPNLHENVQYPVAGARADRGDSPWRQDRERAKGPFTAARRDDERRPPARADAAPERPDAARDRSPLRARRHSPSPRSPRRSWALEKRRSPPPRDAPPPPVWPGPDQDYPEPDRPAWTPAARRDRYSPKPPRVSRFEPATKFEPRNPEFEPRDPKFEPREPKFEARDPKFEARDPKFEARDPKFELRDPKFEPRDSKFGPRDPKYGSRDPKFGSRDPKFESRDPKFEVRDTKFEVRDPKFEARDSKFDSRDHKFDSRDPKFEPRDPKFDHRDAKYESRDSKFDLRENKFDSRGPRFDPRDVKFEPRDSKFDMRGPKFEPRDTKFDSRDPIFEPRDHPKFEPRDHPKFEPRDHPKFESRIHPKFEPRDSKFDRRDTKFESRDPKFEHRDPKFEPRDMKFDQRDTKFDSREPKFERRDPKFEPRDPKFDPRDLEGPSDRRDFRRADDGPDRRGYPDREDFRNFHDYDRQRDDFRREDFRREERKDDRRGPEVFDKEFDDIYKRAMEFKQKVQELRRTGGRSRDREEFTDERHRPDDRRKFHDDRRDEDTRQDYRRDMDRREDRPRIRDEDFGRQRDPEWRIEESKPKPLDSAAKVKREKAAEEIAEKILLKHATFSMNEDIKARVIKEMKYMVLEIINDMFGRDDVSFIETVIKFRAAHNDRDEYKIFQKVMGSLPDHQKSGKRPGEESSETPAKTSRRSPENLNQDATSVLPVDVHNWEYNMGQTSLVANMMPQMFMNPTLNVMVPSPFTPMYEAFPQIQQIPEELSKDDGFNLFLCKTDFKPYSAADAEYLKNYIVTEILAVTENAQGWAPDLTLKGLQSQFRYQVHTFDEASKDWLLRVDFSRLNVLTYTKEELWYERAAIWLPGHSRCRNLEPLEKLQLQNRKLEGADIGKWKLVRKIVNTKGTRVYFDMPPSSARALEKHKMLLSYELQKVNVYLKAVAVDKDAFDSGLKEHSCTDQSEIVAAVQNSPMPSLPNDPNMVKVTLKGCKSMSLMQARKIKEIIIYNLFKYHQSAEDTGRTDFVKYGFCSPDCFAVVPENEESKKWLTALNIGRMNKHPIVVVGADDSNTVRYIRMTVIIPHDYNLKPARVIEQLRKSNHGIKGLHFTLWKLEGPVKTQGRKCSLPINIDLESLETIAEMNFQLDYVDDSSNIGVATFISVHSNNKLLEIIQKYKSEMQDSYDVANMEISQSDSDDDIIFMGPRLVTAPRPSPKAGVPTVRRPVAKPEMKRPMHKDGPVKKPAGETGAPEPRAGGARQLDALTARVLEDELQQVMIEVWQLLPDDPPCNVEKMLVDKLRNEAGDQIRDILGLNVTKRLLNTFNPLNVKVHFTTKPERKYLRQFLKDYNFVAFKRIARVDNTFAAQVRTVADYDRLCARRDIHCGAAKITITPYYRFRQCPKNLKTIYSNVDEDKDTENTEALEKDNMEECDDPNEANSNDITSASDGAKQTVEDTSQAKTVTTVTKSVATSTADEESTTKLNNSSTNKDSNSTTAKDIDSSTTKVNESSSGNETKTSPNQIVEVKPQPKEAPKLQVENKSQQTLSRATTDSTKPETTVSTAVELQPKTVPAPQDTAVTAKPGKVEPAQTQVEKKATPTKAQPKLEPVKPKIENKTENTKPIIENKTETAKPKVGNKTENAKPLAKVEPVKAQVAAIKPKPKQVPKTTNAVPKSKNVVKPPNRNSIINAKNNRKSADVVKGKQITKNKAKVKKSFEEKDDFEELDDEDILALMSGGIVLDECSGSDEE